MLSLENTIIEWVVNTFEWLGYPGIFIFMIIEPTVLPFPGEIILTLAGWILVESTFGLIIVSALASTGTLIGCSVEYYLSNKYGISLIDKFGKYVFISSYDIQNSEKYFIKYGSMFVILTRLIPLFPKPITSIIAGIYKMNIYKFIIITFIASFPSNLLYIYVGTKLGTNYEKISEYINPVRTPLLIGLGLIILFYFMFKFYKIRIRS
ncbi:MAG: DedA family protein [Dehalococcoidia bacterium]|nr:DedA family protein [Dehalococcoidia bacterium]